MHTCIHVLLAAVSRWSDEYVGSCMFSSENDAMFENSTSNYIFPRTAVAAGSFWRWDRRVNVLSPAFAAAFDAMQRRLRARGVATCPCTTLVTNGCDQNTYCGQPYCASGAHWTCDDYAADTQWSCRTARAGLSGTHSIMSDFTIPCTTLESCLKVAVWRCNVTFASRGCNGFSMSNSIDPEGGRGAVASFFRIPPGATLPFSAKDNAWTFKASDRTGRIRSVSS